ncbi:MAG: hypothetical protein ACAH95_08040 [Fimbriimonas sp.]
MLTTLVCLAAITPQPRHAVLFHLPGEDGRNDCLLMQEGLSRRSPSITSEIHELRDQTSWVYLSEAAEHWPDAPLLVFVSGVGGVDRTRLMPQLRFGDRNTDWATVFQSFPKKPGIELITDTGYTNLLQSYLPPNVVAIVPDATWRDVTQARQVITVVHNGKTMQTGIVSYILAREIPFATSLADLAYRVNKTKDSGSMAAMWAELPRLKLLGRDSKL